MRAAVIALLLLAACGPKVDDAAVLPTGGLLVIVHDGARVTTPGSPDGVMPATGQLYTVSEVDVSSNAIEVSAANVQAIGVFDEAFDLTARVPLTLLRVNSALFAEDAAVQGTDYGLGPDGGTIWLTRIEAKAEGGFRVRGQFDGRICPQPDATEDCHRIEGVFAFDQMELPVGANTGTLMAPPA